MSCGCSSKKRLFGLLVIVQIRDFGLYRHFQVQEFSKVLLPGNIFKLNNNFFVSVHESLMSLRKRFKTAMYFGKATYK